MTNTETVNLFLQRLHDSKIREAVSMVTEDIFYHNIPMEPIRGKQAFDAFMSKDTDLEIIDLEVLHSAENGPVVMNERADVFRRNGHVLELPVMGVFELEGGLIRSWRDYFDLATFSNFLSGSRQEG